MVRLRWELSKIWGRPLHDPVFEEIPELHWFMYSKLLSEDKHKSWEDDRDKIEYMARFIDNKAVNELRRLREETKGVDDAGEFNSILRRNFGRGIGSPTKKQMSVKELGMQIARS